MRHAEIVKKWFDEIDLQKYYPGQKSFDDYVKLAHAQGCKIFTDGGWHSGEGYCDDTWEEALYVETAFGTQKVMEIPEEYLGRLEYRDISKWYQPGKYTEKYMAKDKEAFLKELAHAKFCGFKFVGDELKFTKLRKCGTFDGGFAYKIDYIG